MLHIAEQWYGSDLGRQRQGNEDNFFVAAPLFVVADGMGGARAGEVASQLAVDAFAEGLPSEGALERVLVDVIEAANRSIYEFSQGDPANVGMGTTLTALYIDGESAVVAHVGDSRAYRLRGSQFIRLTTDHSLVSELVARGQLTEQEAESHPQRSVITRALGPEPSVTVDVARHDIQDQDLFLICSDGLTAMLSEDEIKAVVAAPIPLADIGRQLIDAANLAGGRDNITVVLVRLMQGEAPQAAPTLQGSRIGAGVTRTSLEFKQRRSRLRPMFSRDRHSPNAPLATRRSPSRRRRKSRILVAATAVCVCLSLIGTGGWLASQAVYFLSVEGGPDQTVALYRGLPYKLPGGLKLYERVSVSHVTLAQVPASRRNAFTDRRLRSYDDAQDLFHALEHGRLQQ